MTIIKKIAALQFLKKEEKLETLNEYMIKNVTLKKRQKKVNKLKLFITDFMAHSTLTAYQFGYVLKVTEDLINTMLDGFGGSLVETEIQADSFITNLIKTYGDSAAEEFAYFAFYFMKK